MYEVANTSPIRKPIEYIHVGHQSQRCRLLAVDSRKCMQSLRYLHLLWFKRVCYGIYSSVDNINPQVDVKRFHLLSFAVKQRS